MSNIIIVGLGSPFGDDRFGWLVIERLQNELSEADDVTTICCDRSGVDWIHQYQPAEKLIFVDAVKSGKVPGTLHHMILTPSEFDNLPAAYSSHGVGIREGLAIAAEVVELPEMIEFYGLELEQCDADTEVSEIIAEQTPALAKQLLTRLTKLYNEQ